MKFDLNVNGKPVSVEAPAEMPLLWVLRDLLNLPGTKFGCGEGQCGACTVHMRGRPVKSCQVQVSTAAGAPGTSAAEIGAATAIEFLDNGHVVAVAEPVRRGGGAAGVVVPK